MAQHQLGPPDESREALKKAVEIADTQLPPLASADLGSGWHEWLIADILLREARELIEKKQRPGIQPERPETGPAVESGREQNLSNQARSSLLPLRLLRGLLFGL